MAGTLRASKAMQMHRQRIARRQTKNSPKKVLKNAFELSSIVIIRFVRFHQSSIMVVFDEVQSSTLYLRYKPSLSCTLLQANMAFGDRVKNIIHNPSFGYLIASSWQSQLSLSKYCFHYLDRQRQKNYCSLNF